MVEVEVQEDSSTKETAKKGYMKVEKRSVGLMKAK